MFEPTVSDETEPPGIELAETGTSPFTNQSFNLDSPHDDGDDHHHKLQWGAVERLPTFKRVKMALFQEKEGKSMEKSRRVADVSKLDAFERHLFVDKLIKDIENDNLRLLQKIRSRIDRVDIELPTVEVRFNNLYVEAGCKVVHGKPLPTLWNATISMFSVFKNVMGSKQESKIKILKGVSGVLKPKRMSLLLGPPGCGKTTLLSALSGRLSPSLKVRGEVHYNGYGLNEFVPEKTSAYVSQNDLHIPELSVRETLDFSACCQGTRSRAEIMLEISRREKQMGVVPDADIDAYMKAVSVEGLKRSLQTDYILKILGLEVCADTRVGDAMRRGISGGQKKRLTTGEMIAGPIKALFMDEISNGLDSSTTFQIISCLQQFVHINDATALISLLQPDTETFELFDDIILMSEGKIVYQGTRSYICKFFEDCGFKCPERKGVADFLQEVISKKDQEKYWYKKDIPYNYITVDQLIQRFKECEIGLELKEELCKPFDKLRNRKDALSFRKYSLTKWEMLKACSRRELALMKRNSFVYIFKSILLVFVASITMTVFLHTGRETDIQHGNYIMGSLFYALFVLLADGLPELTLTLSRLPVFYKQKQLYFYPAWAYAIPSAILKIPLSVLEAFIWTLLTYYVIGYSPEVERLFRQFLIFFAVHFASISLFRAAASVFRAFTAATTVAALSILLLMLFGGFIIRKPSMPSWLEWAFWVSPLSYGQIGLTANEFFAPRWDKEISGNITVGQQVLEDRGLNFGHQFYWIAFSALIGFALFFNTVFALALTFLRSPGRARAIISDKNTQAKRQHANSSNDHRRNGKMVLPFEPLTVSFEDVRYYVDTPLAMRKKGIPNKKLQLLSNVTGAFRPGILTALMGVSGAGKTTLLDVLSGRKTGGTIEGEIRIGGYLKVQETFARVSGYCEQFDIHSPHITVEESVMYSAWLRLPSRIGSKTMAEIVAEVLDTIELDEIKDSLVGVPGMSGLTTEQRKRLTIAVELVANPSIVFMDEPTSGLDARAAAIVMRAVKNVVNTGRTVVCTIHQPSIDIFEAFDELILMKSGGRIIYSGPLGQGSSKVIEYFESIPGVAKIKENYNPAAWMLDVTSKSAEAKLGVDFADVYMMSALYKENTVLVKQFSSPSPDSQDLHFQSRFPRTSLQQLKACLWKQHLSYWRNPSYNLTRIIFVLTSSLLFGLLFWQKAKEINDQQDMFNIFGCMYTTVLMIGINNCSTVLYFVSTERNVFYRERFAGMYSSWAYSISQVLVEIPYSMFLSAIYVMIVYPMIGYQWSAQKILWMFYSMFCSLLAFNYLGMLLVALTPNIHVAFTVRSSFYSIVNLFSGYIIPKPRIPKWWIWMYYLSPTSWVLNGLLTSQYGDIKTEISAFGETKKVSDFLKDYFDYRHDFLGVIGIVLAAFPIVFALLFGFCIDKINFQKR